MAKKELLDGSKKMNTTMKGVNATLRFIPHKLLSKRSLEKIDAAFNTIETIYKRAKEEFNRNVDEMADKFYKSIIFLGQEYDR